MIEKEKYYNDGITLTGIILVGITLVGIIIAGYSRLYIINISNIDEFSGFIAFLLVFSLFIFSYYIFQFSICCIYDCILGVNAQNNTTKSIANILRKKEKAEKEIKEKKLDKIKKYTKNVLGIYLENPTELEKMYKYIELYQLAEKKEDILIDSVIRVKDLNTIDLQHYAWNIGEMFRKNNTDRAQFVYNIFKKDLDVSFDTFKKKLKDKNKSIIKLEEKDSPFFELN